MRRTAPLLLLLACAACRQAHSTKSAGLDPPLAGYVPADTLLLLDVRLQGPDSLLTTPVYQKYLSGMPLPQVDDFARSTGLDPRKDVAELVFCSNGKQGAMIGRGRFQPRELESKLTAQGASRIDYKSYRLLGNEKNAAVFVSESVAMTGSTPMLRAMLDLKGRGRPPEWLEALVRTIPAGTQFRAAFGGGVLRLPVPDSSNLANLNRLARAIESGVFYADLRSGIEFTAKGTCTDEAGARQVHDALKGFIGLGRLSTPDNKPDLLRLYDSIRVEQSGRSVSASATIPPDLVDQFFQTFAK